jgi:hypothetical protein
MTQFCCEQSLHLGCLVDCECNTFPDITLPLEGDYVLYYRYAGSDAIHQMELPNLEAGVPLRLPPAFNTSVSLDMKLRQPDGQWFRIAPFECFRVHVQPLAPVERYQVRYDCRWPQYQPLCNCPIAIEENIPFPGTRQRQLYFYDSGCPASISGYRISWDQQVVFSDAIVVFLDFDNDGVYELVITPQSEECQYATFSYLITIAP